MAKKSRKPTTTAVRERPPKEDRTPLPKDDAELELEKLVFGDLSGFQQSLRENAGALEKYYSSDDEEGDNVVEGGAEEGVGGPGEDLAALADDEVRFFFFFFLFCCLGCVCFEAIG